MLVKKGRKRKRKRCSLFKTGGNNKKRRKGKKGEVFIREKKQGRGLFESDRKRERETEQTSKNIRCTLKR